MFNEKLDIVYYLGPTPITDGYEIITAFFSPAQSLESDNKNSRDDMYRISFFSIILDKDKRFERILNFNHSYSSSLNAACLSDMISGIYGSIHGYYWKQLCRKDFNTKFEVNF